MNQKFQLPPPGLSESELKALKTTDIPISISKFGSDDDYNYPCSVPMFPLKPNNDKNHVCLITGANRGIGLAFVKTLINLKFNVIATYRSKSASNQLLNIDSEYLHTVQYDVTDFESSSSLLQNIESILSPDKKLVLVINNSGVAPVDLAISQIQLKSLENCLKVNVMGPIWIIKTLEPILLNSGTSDFPAMVINISSSAGSCEAAQATKQGGLLVYRTSKAALDMVSVSTDLQWRASGKHVRCISMHPGPVKTDLSAPVQKIIKRDWKSPEYAANLILNQWNVLRNKSHDQVGGKLFDLYGREWGY